MHFPSRRLLIQCRIRQRSLTSEYLLYESRYGCVVVWGSGRQFIGANQWGV